MATRKALLATGEIYHVFNRSIARQPIFSNIRANNRFRHTADFYRFENSPMRYSHLIRLKPEIQSQVLDKLYSSGVKSVTLFAFAIMPNHFHFLLRQEREFGIKRFLSQVQNSYAKYYNTKSDRSGSVFQEMFKAVRIETDEQFIYVARYIHLNPITSYILKTPEELIEHPWTSLSCYVGKTNVPFLDTNMLLSHFKNKPELKNFTFDQVDYQRELDKIKHLT